MQVWGSRTGRVKGREQELAVLAGLDARLATRGGRSVALVGEPGVGVSALLGAFRRHAGHRSGGGDGAAGGGALGSWRSALDELLAAGAAVAPVMVLVGDAADRDAATDDPVLGAIAAALDAAAAIEPFVVVLDHLDAADPASQRLVDLVTERPRSAPWLLVTAGRRPAGRGPGRIEVVVRGLPTELLVARLLTRPGDPAGPAQGSNLLRAASGNLAVLDALATGGPLADRPRDRTLIAAVVAHRLEAVQAADVAEVVAAIGRPVTAELVAGVLGRSPDAVRATLHRAAARGVVAEVGATAGAGELVEMGCAAFAEAVAHAMSEDRRRAVHRAVAEVLVAGPGDVTADVRLEAADHALQAGVADRFTVELVLAAAGELEPTDPRRAIALLESARPLAGSAADRVAVGRLLGRLYGRAGDLVRARAAFAEALEHAAALDVDQRADLLVDQAGVEQHRDPGGPGLVELVQATLAGLGTRRPATRAVLLGRLATLLVLRDPAVSRAAALGGVELACRSGEPDGLVHALHALALVGCSQPRLAQLAEIDTRLGQVPSAASPAARLLSRSALCVARGTGTELDDVIEQVEAELAARPGERWGIEVEVLRLGRAIDAAAAGEVQAAVDAVVAAARRADSRGALLGYAAQLIWKLHTGRMLFVAADTGARVAVDSGYSDVLVFGHSVVDAELGDEAARDRLGSLGRDRLRRRTDWTWGAWTALLARAAPIMSDRALALDVVDELLPMVEEFLLLTPDLAIGPVGWFVAETQLWVGDGPGAIHSALAGLSAARRRGSLPWVARSLLQVASVARATGHSLDLAG